MTEQSNDHKRTNLERGLRGLLLPEMMLMIHQIIEHGERTVGCESYARQRHSEVKVNAIWWSYDFIGIPVEFYYYRALHPNFRLSGDGWAISFKCSRSASPRGITEYYDVRFPRLTEDQPDPLPMYFAHSFRRRGSLDRFKRDMSLLRMTL
jgi:hypothetical protein